MQAWGILSRDPQHDNHNYVVAAAKWCTRLILHSVLHVATRWDKCHQRATLSVWNSKRLLSNKREIPRSDAIISWSEKFALIGVAPLISQPSLSG